MPCFALYSNLYLRNKKPKKKKELKKPVVIINPLFRKIETMSKRMGAWQKQRVHIDISAHIWLWWKEIFKTNFNQNGIEKRFDQSIRRHKIVRTTAPSPAEAGLYIWTTDDGVDKQTKNSNENNGITIIMTIAMENGEGKKDPSMHG